LGLGVPAGALNAKELETVSKDYLMMEIVLLS
jgi:hypothetical protein